MCPRCLMEIAQSWSVGGAPAGEPPPPEELAALFPALEVGELLGRGGMGAVYKARHKELDRPVALKILPPEVYSDPTFAERFEREARTLARLDHPNVVRVYDAGRSGGRYYLVMELVDGVDLRQMIRAGRVEPREALAIVGQVCDALQYAHDQGVVHRDVKPENILVDRQGRVKIADFGLAKLLGREPGAYTLTRSDQAMGTLHYMAPEQVEHPLAVDHRADIYSLGVVFYELLTGELPLGRFQPPSAKVAVDVRLDDVVLRTLEKEPERRYQHASDVKVAVGDASRPAQHTPPPVPPAASARHRIHDEDVEQHAHAGHGRHRGGRRSPWPWALGCGCLALIVPALGAVWLFVGVSSRAEVARSEAMRAHEQALRAQERAQQMVPSAAELPPGEGADLVLDLGGEAPRLTQRVVDELGIDAQTLGYVNQLLKQSRALYLELEAGAMEREVVEPGEVRVTFPAFETELELLERAMWRSLDEYLDDAQLDLLREAGLAEALMPYGREPVELVIEQQASGYFEISVQPESGGSRWTSTPVLPDRYERFWQE
jgi:tRNA A-37 threonylcarbamoyl transferase component Bud32